MSDKNNLTPAESIRAKMLGEHLIRELRALPVEKWHVMSVPVLRMAEGGLVFEPATLSVKLP